MVTLDLKNNLYWNMILDILLLDIETSPKGKCYKVNKEDST